MQKREKGGQGQGQGIGTGREGKGQGQGQGQGQGDKDKDRDSDRDKDRGDLRNILKHWAHDVRFDSIMHIHRTRHCLELDLSTDSMHGSYMG